MKPKRLDIFILRSFLLLFAAAFFICLFVLLMNILWRWVGDLVGKGFSLGVLAQFFWLFALTLVPTALPLAVLMASLITFGNFGERLELLAMKTAGISLLRIMKPLFIFSAILAGISFYFQNVIVPDASRKLYSLIYSIERKNPELEIPEGVFYSQLTGFNLHVAHKDTETGMLYDMTIYDLRDGYENLSVIVADSAYLETTADQHHMYLHLFSGEQFSQDKQVDSQGQPYRRESFREKHLLVDFNSDFDVVDANMMTGQAASKNMGQIRHTIDSLSARQDTMGIGNLKDFMSVLFTYSISSADSAALASAPYSIINADSMYAVATRDQQYEVRKQMRSKIQTQASEMSVRGTNMFYGDRSIRKHWIEWMKKISLCTSVLVFFFIGAPLGAIIRKGGLGVPVIISVLTFILYYITSVSGEKMFREGEWSMIGCWFSTLVLAPLSIFFTVKAYKDSTVFQLEAYKEFFRHWFGGRLSRNITRKDVIIEEPDPAHCLALLADVNRHATSILDKGVLGKLPDYMGLFFREHVDSELDNMERALEDLVVEMSNSRDHAELELLNELPIMPVYGVEKPFGNKWVNIVVGCLLPLGLIFELRAWLFSRKLRKQVRTCVSVTDRMIKKINNIPE